MEHCFAFFLMGIGILHFVYAYNNRCLKSVWEVIIKSQENEIILEVIHRRYQSSSTVIATNRPIEDWGKIFGDNATA